MSVIPCAFIENCLLSIHFLPPIQLGSCGWELRHTLDRSPVHYWGNAETPALILTQPHTIYSQPPVLRGNGITKAQGEHAGGTSRGHIQGAQKDPDLLKPTVAVM